MNARKLIRAFHERRVAAGNARHSLPASGFRLATPGSSAEHPLRLVSRWLQQAVPKRAFPTFFTTKQREGERGSGTVLRIVLPACHGEAAHVGQVSDARLTRGYVLVVEGDAMVRSTLQRALGERYFLTCPKTSIEALALLEAGMRFDLILCDLVVPVLSGSALYGTLVRRYPDQARRTAFLTGGAFNLKDVEFIRSVPNRAIEKPFDAQQLREVVNGLLLELGILSRPRGAS